jgi:hypothetical protein
MRRFADRIAAAINQKISTLAADDGAPRAVVFCRISLARFRNQIEGT